MVWKRRISRNGLSMIYKMMNSFPVPSSVTRVPAASVSYYTLPKLCPHWIQGLMSVLPMWLNKTQDLGDWNNHKQWNILRLNIIKIITTAIGYQDLPWVAIISDFRAMNKIFSVSRPFTSNSYSILEVFIDAIVAATITAINAAA